ncbi:IS66 family transposase [Metallibacterium sp.]
MEAKAEDLTCRSSRSVPAGTQHAAPLLQNLKVWLDQMRPAVTGACGAAKAIDYTFHRWSVLTRYLEDSRDPIGNRIERATHCHRARAAPLKSTILSERHRPILIRSQRALPSAPSLINFQRARVASFNERQHQTVRGTPWPNSSTPLQPRTTTSTLTKTPYCRRCRGLSR